MNKAEFLQALEAGLSAASPEERVAALQYYGEYLDEAGPELEQQVLAELGSPQKVAADILASLGIAADATPAEQPPAAAAMPPEPGPAPAPQGAAPVHNFPPLPPLPAVRTATPLPPPVGGQAKAGYNENNSNVAKIILIILVVICLAPVLGGLLAGLVGLAAGLLVLFLVPLIVGVSLVAAGIAAVVGSSFLFAGAMPSGLVNLGLGLLCIGLGLMCCYAGGVLLGRVLPLIVRTVAGAIGRLFRKIFPARTKVGTE
ncbi:MAG: DUF1700 domain-containing protein [Oscillospiraceae bacterium]